MADTADQVRPGDIVTQVAGLPIPPNHGLVETAQPADWGPGFLTLTVWIGPTMIGLTVACTDPVELRP